MTNNASNTVRALSAIELGRVSGGCNCPPGGCPGATNQSYRTDSTGKTYTTYLDCGGQAHFYVPLQN